MKVRHIHAKPGQYIAVHRNRGGSGHNGNDFGWLKLIIIGVGIWLVISFWQVIVALVITGVALWLLWIFRDPIWFGIRWTFGQLWNLCVMEKNKYQRFHPNDSQNDSSPLPSKKTHHRFVILLLIKVLVFCLILGIGYAWQQPVLQLRKNSKINQTQIRFAISANSEKSGTKINYHYLVEDHPLEVSNMKLTVVEEKKYPFNTDRLSGSIRSQLFETEKIKDYEIQIKTKNGEEINYLHSRDYNLLPSEPSDAQMRMFFIGGILIVFALLFAGFEIRRNCNIIFQQHRKIGFLTELVFLLVISALAWWTCGYLWGLIGGILLYKFLGRVHKFILHS